jgi:hypothetical protein
VHRGCTDRRCVRGRGRGREGESGCLCTACDRPCAHMLIPPPPPLPLPSSSLRSFLTLSCSLVPFISTTSSRPLHLDHFHLQRSSSPRRRKFLPMTGPALLYRRQVPSTVPVDLRSVVQGEASAAGSVHHRLRQGARHQAGGTGGASTRA